MKERRQRPPEREAHPITCPQCGKETPISFNRRRDDPRYCRHCGAQIAEPLQEAAQI